MTNEAPERIWTDPSGIDTDDIICGTISPPRKGGYVNCDIEYIRADIAQARIAELEAALRYISTYANASAEIDPDEARTEAEAASAFAHIEAKARTALEAKPC